MTDRVVIVDYGLGNLFSVQRACARLGAAAVISADRSVLERAAVLILPGVGAFGEGMQNLRACGLVDPLRAHAGAGKALLGICLGMQLLLSESEEGGRHQGLGLVPGHVVRLREPDVGGERYKIPHVGWSALVPANGEASDSWDGTPLGELGADPYMYFVHSYVASPDDPAHRLAETRYGRDRFCSVLRSGSIVGCQFHPERSGPLGLRLLGAFLDDVRREAA